MFFVAGITGKVGGSTARHLLAAGKQVRALVRDENKAADWAKQGVELRKGDLDDVAALTGALEGVEGAFLMTPPNMAPEPGFPASQAIADSLRKAVLQARPPRIAVLSSIGSEQTSKLGLITGTHQLEQALRGTAPAIGFVRAGSFLENYAGLLPVAAQTGHLYSMYLPVEKAVPYIATEDIGAELAKLLLTDWQGERLVELGTDIATTDVAAALGRVLGRDVRAVGVPRETWAQTMQGFGIPEGKTWGYEEMLDSFNSGWIHFGVAGTEAVAGTTTPEQVFAQLHKPA